jgi:putative transposase
MQIRKGYKFRLKLKADDARKLRQFAGCCRFVWNRALAAQDELFRDENAKLLTRTELINKLPDWKREHPFLADAQAQILQQTLKDLDLAYRAFFRRLKKIRAGDYSEGSDPGYPRFKKKYLHDSFRFPQGFKFQGRHVFLPKLGWFRFYKSREIQGVPKNVTVTRDGPHWYISVQVKQEIPDPAPAREPSAGMDLGVSRFLTLSDGSYTEPLDAFRNLEDKLAREQRKLSRKVRFSANWRKQKARVNRVYRKIRDSRRDFLHKTSTALARSYSVLYAEALNVQGMSASAKGTAESPGKNVRAKAGLNKAVLDQGWSELLRQLEYKLSRRGGELVRVSPRDTSRACSRCGYVSENNRKSQSRFECTACGLMMHADENAAVNIATLGQRGWNACGDERLLSSMKQEPPGNGDRVPAPA